MKSRLNTAMISPADDPCPDHRGAKAGAGVEAENQMNDHGSLRDSHEKTAPFHTPGAE
jgi:hypothetical protein